ncbi:hypothetical protein MAGR_12870 [Mycolicibacterium agri]|uniref:Uncharacterized protein n=1 Tax=Mycolicibacterium agri TaxID=36811 RepID=A0A7I9VXZ4_MYCAG|nr:hypothetical protein MAGR_12870 [Mycolicibacterium agri]
MHGKQLAQLGECFVAGFVARRGQHFFEKVFDQIVLVGKEFHDIIGRLHKCLNHGEYLRSVFG